MAEQNPVKAIRAKCLDCAESQSEVSACPVTDCPLYPFRFGKNPYRKKTEISEERRQAMIEQLAKARAKQNTNELA